MWWACCPEGAQRLDAGTQVSARGAGGAAGFLRWPPSWKQTGMPWTRHGEGVLPQCGASFVLRCLSLFCTGFTQQVSMPAGCFQLRETPAFGETVP